MSAELYNRLLNNNKPLHELVPEEQAVIIRASISGTTTLYERVGNAFETVTTNTLDPLKIYRINGAYVNYSLKAKCPLCKAPCVVNSPCLYTWHVYCSECDYGIFHEELENVIAVHNEIWDKINTK